MKETVIATLRLFVDPRTQVNSRVTALFSTPNDKSSQRGCDSKRPHLYEINAPPCTEYSENNSLVPWFLLANWNSFVCEIEPMSTGCLDNLLWTITINISGKVRWFFVFVTSYYGQSTITLNLSTNDGCRSNIRSHEYSLVISLSTPVL